MQSVGLQVGRGSSIEGNWPCSYEMEEQYVRITPEHDRRERIQKRLSSCIGHPVDGFIRRTSCTSPRNCLLKVSCRLSTFARNTGEIERVRSESRRRCHSHWFLGDRYGRSR